MQWWSVGCAGSTGTCTSARSVRGAVRRAQRVCSARVQRAMLCGSAVCMRLHMQSCICNRVHTYHVHTSDLDLTSISSAVKMGAWSETVISSQSPERESPVSPHGPGGERHSTRSHQEGTRAWLGLGLGSGSGSGSGLGLAFGFGLGLGLGFGLGLGLGLG